MIFGLSYIRIAAYAVIAIAMGYLIYQYRTGQAAKAEVETLQKANQELIDYHNAYVKRRADQDAITEKVSHDYENAVTDLVGQLNAARDANSHIRVCHAVPQASPSSTAPSGPHDPSEDRPSGTTEQVVSTSELYEIAGEAAECGQRLNHLQDWIRSQAAIAAPN